MVPAPTLDELVRSVIDDAPSDGPLERLGQAARTAAALEVTADALVGHFVDQSRLSGHTWSQISHALGVSKQAVHKRFSMSGSTLTPGVPAFERFTPRAKAALQEAEETARQRGSEAVEPSDLLIALFAQTEGIAARALKRLGVTRADTERALSAGMPAGGSATPARPPFGASAKAVLTRSLDEALRLGHNYIGTEHLLLGLGLDPGDPAAQILIDAGASYDDLNAAIAHELGALPKE